MPRLPYELQILILDWVYILSQGGEVDYAFLAAASVVSKSWTPIAQRLLFRRIPAFIGGRNISFLRILASLKLNPALGAHIVSFRFHADSPQPTKLVDILTLCPHIAELSLNTHLSPQQRYSLFQNQAFLSTLPITVLVLPPYPVIVADFIALFPHIRHLYTRTHYQPTGTSPFPASLRSISLPWTEIRERFLSWLLQPTLGQLSEVEVEDVALSPFEPTGTNYDLFAALAPSITSFTSLWLLPPRILALLSALEEIIFRRLPHAPCELPASVQHVGYHWDATGAAEDETEERVAHLFSAMKVLKGLRIVTATRFSGQATLDMLEKGCRELGVGFVIYTDPKSFPRARYVDWL